MEYVIMTVGKTHSGKTTFGKKLVEKIKKSCLLDFDMLVEFLKITYPWLYDSENFKTSKDANDAHYISLKIRNMILKQAIKTDLSIIFTNANSLKRLRKDVKKSAHKAGRKLIMIYFNRPESVLLDRIEKTKRDKLCLSRSKDFKDLLINRQNKIFEEPSCKEADLFFEINDEKSLKETESKILKLIKN